jgi:hypothetical protein
VTRRTARFALGGAAVVATAALIYVAALPFTERVYRRKAGRGYTSSPGPTCSAAGLEMTPIEAVAWFVILGTLAGGLLGIALARVRRHEWTFELGGAGLIGTVGFCLGVALDEFTTQSGDVGSGPYNSFFGWAIAPAAAWALWTAIGAAIGGVLGLIAARESRRT